MDGNEVAIWGGKLHGQMRGGDDDAKGVERAAAKEDVIRCGCVNDEEADKNGLGLGSITEDGVEVNVAASGNLFSRKAINWFIIWDHGCVWKLKLLVCCPVEDVDETVLVDEDFFNCVVFYFNSDDHRVVLLVVEVVEVVVREGDGRHSTSVMGMGNVIDGLIWQRCFFLAEEVDPPLAKPPEMVLIVPRRRGLAGVTSVRAGWGSWLVDWLGRLS